MHIVPAIHITIISYGNGIATGYRRKQPNTKNGIHCRINRLNSHLFQTTVETDLLRSRPVLYLYNYFAFLVIARLTCIEWQIQILLGCRQTFKCILIFVYVRFPLNSSNHFFVSRVDYSDIQMLSRGIHIGHFQSFHFISIHGIFRNEWHNKDLFIGVILKALIRKNKYFNDTDNETNFSTNSISLSTLLCVVLLSPTQYQHHNFNIMEYMLRLNVRARMDCNAASVRYGLWHGMK